MRPWPPNAVKLPHRARSRSAKTATKFNLSKLRSSGPRSLPRRHKPEVFMDPAIASTKLHMLCRNLRSKEMFHQSPGQAEDEFSSGIYWCSKTCENFGPDSQ